MQLSYSLSTVWAVILTVRPLLRVLVARGLLVGFRWLPRAPAALSFSLMPATGSFFG